MADESAAPLANSAGQIILHGRVVGDVYDRFEIHADGDIRIGDGTVPGAEANVGLASALFAWRHFR